jgi:glycosyltransferase involved in cell wall biosynthesis
MTVTVLLITYNHERFIAQAIESVLMQQTSFDYELVVIEDCSTDRTRDIVTDYQRKHPHRIRAVLAATNEHNTKAWTREALAARGRYIAFLDGDDYWTDPGKLQKQADFLDTHPECALCYHNVLMFDDEGREAPRLRYTRPQPAVSTRDDLLAGNFIHACSVMSRARLVDPFPSWFDEFRLSGDWAILILNAQHGHIGYLDEVMATYRRHSGGVWSRLTPIQQTLRVLDFYRRIDAHLGVDHVQSFRDALRYRGGELLLELRDAAKHRRWRDVARGVAGLLRYYPEHVVTECWPAYRPLQFRRYPILWRLAAARRRRLATQEGSNDVKYEGYLDQADHRRLSGWAWNRGLPDVPLDIEVWEGSALVGHQPADLFRFDLKAAGVGNGYHAFVMDLPPRFADGRPHALEIRVAGAEPRATLPGTPVEILAPTTVH